MTKYSGSINSIESCSFLDGPGLRTVIFLNGCYLRCLYCHNPEMWKKNINNFEVNELIEKILNNKPYFENGGGVTFSGGEPLFQIEFLTEICKKLKENNVHVALDTSGVGSGNYTELLKYVDLVILDIKHTEKEGFNNLTKSDIEKTFSFYQELKRQDKPLWIRQVIIPGMTDSIKYLRSLKEFLKQFSNVEKIEFLPFHNRCIEKYEALNISFPLKHVKEMNVLKTKELLNIFTKQL
jgi:pyruvate formate lyase activating enzyme